MRLANDLAAQIITTLPNDDLDPSLVSVSLSAMTIALASYASMIINRGIPVESKKCKDDMERIAVEISAVVILHIPESMIRDKPPMPPIGDTPPFSQN